MQKPKLLMKIGDGEEFNIEDRVPGLKYLGDDATQATTNQLTQITGIDGAIYSYKTYNNYQIPANFYLQFHNWEDYKLAKHEIMKIFATRKLIRIRTDVESAIVRFVLPTVPTIAPSEATSHYSLFTENFDNPSGYRYSIFRSDSDWSLFTKGDQLGMNIPDGETLNYHFTTTKFKVYNASDIAVDPYKQKHDLKIVSKFSGNNLKITNKTNSTSWTYNKSTNGGDTVILDGINTTLNGKPASVDTDYGHIVLDPGWNDIETSGAGSVDITFSFPFVYL